MCQLFILIENDRSLTAVRRSNKQASKQAGRHNSQTGQLFDSVKEREESLVGLFSFSPLLDVVVVVVFFLLASDDVQKRK
jgi:hypothetical protein